MRCGNWQAAYFLPFDYNIVRIPIAVMVKLTISMPFSLLSVPYLAELVANRAFCPPVFLSDRVRRTDYLHGRGFPISSQRSGRLL